jgi:VanZ family protein
MHKTTAWPLALVYMGLVVYASLYPFAEWRNQGIAPWSFLFSPLPRYWSGFDVAINMVGYAPLGALAALGALRAQRPMPHVLVLATLLCCLLSLCMEGVQSYLPARVASREDWLLNSSGALFGASMALLLERLGIVDRWSRMRARWFVPQARGALVLLAVWPPALLFPASVPFGLGQVWQKVEAALNSYLIDTPFFDWLAVRDSVPEPLLPGAEMLCVALGLLIPCLLGFCVIRGATRRALFALVVMVVGCAVSALSAALSWGPTHAWAWVDLPAQVGMTVALLVALPLALMPWRASAALLLLALGLLLSMLNQAPESPYFAQTLLVWEQGHFIRFHGVTQWLGWLWPYGVLLYVLTAIVRRDGQN